MVVALTDRKRLQALARLFHGRPFARDKLSLDGWPGFRDDLKAALADLKVSHRAERKVSGQLHEETFYGKTNEEGVWVARKPVEKLSPNEIKGIRDDGIRRIVESRLNEHGIEFGRGKKTDKQKWKQALANLEMPSGVPIRKVRVKKTEGSILPVREGTPNEVYVKPGSTHHLCIFEFEAKGKTKREAIFVTMLEAVQRLKAKEPIIQRTHPERPDARFVMSLSRGETVLADWHGEEKLLVFKTAVSSSPQGQIRFAEHSDARRSKDYRKFPCSANTLDARKVTIDALGRQRWAND